MTTTITHSPHSIPQHLENEIWWGIDRQDLPFKHSSHQLCIKKQKCFVKECSAKVTWLASANVVVQTTKSTSYR